MPELPEVETIARGLAPHLPDRTIRRVVVARPDIIARPGSARAFRAAMRGRLIREVRRRGKNVLIELDDELRLLVNLGMTGRLVLSERPESPELRHVAVRFLLDDGRALLYDDVRRFGRMELHDAESWPERDALFGLEPLDDEMNAAAFHARTAASRVPIRTFLLDQRKVTGIGNIYANEALFRAGVDPARPASSLHATESARLRDTIRAVLRDAIEARGTTFSDYRDAAGEPGGFQLRLQVYGREGEPCARCGTVIERIVITNRSAFLCPSCQQ